MPYILLKPPGGRKATPQHSTWPENISDLWSFDIGVLYDYQLIHNKSTDANIELLFSVLLKTNNSNIVS